MAMSSDACRSLNSPYVTLLLKFVEPSGQICHRSFEMTISQFQVCICCYECCLVCVNSVFLIWWLGFSLQNFHKQFKEIAAVMEMVWPLKHNGANTMVCWQFKMIKALYSLMLHFLSHTNSGCTLNCAVIRFTEQKSTKIVWQLNTPELVLIFNAV